MIDLRPCAALGATRNEWLQAAHHFSFARYQDVARTDWGDLRSLNHNILAPRAEMRPHPIDGTEIVTVVRRGVIAHAGSFGGSARVVTGEVELISSGAGMTHAFVNPGNVPAEYLEIRIAAIYTDDRPARRIARFPGRKQSGELVVLASGFAEDRQAMQMRTEARVLGARLAAGVSSRYRLAPGRHAYIVALGGELAINGIILHPRTGAAIADEPIVRIDALKAAEFLLIDTK
ncbi:MAG: pirin family protein [Sphingomonas bacterium]